MIDRYAGTRSLVALGIERWSSRSAVDRHHLQQDLTRLAEEALTAVRIDPSHARRQPTCDGLLQSFPADVPKRRLTQSFVSALDEGLREHVYLAPTPARRMRLRVALHAGDLVDEGTVWQGPAVVEVRRLLDSDVLRRVLREAATSTLAVLVSEQWYDEVIAPGWVSERGYHRVVIPGEDRVREAWVRVPGIGSPPGLTSADLPTPSPPAQRGRRSDVHGRVGARDTGV